jgi:hypothetical protein
MRSTKQTEALRDKAMHAAQTANIKVHQRQVDILSMFVSTVKSRLYALENGCTQEDVASSASEIMSALEKMQDVIPDMVSIVTSNVDIVVDIASIKKIVKKTNKMSKNLTIMHAKTKKLCKRQ